MATEEVIKGLVPKPDAQSRSERNEEEEIQKAGEKSGSCSSFSCTFVDEVFQHVAVTILSSNT